jgi:hypothetical protein
MRGATFALSITMMLAATARGAAQERDLMAVPTTPACPTPAAGRAGAAGAAGDSAARAAGGEARVVGGDTAGDPRDRPDVILLVALQADEVRFASQPRIEVRLCGGLGDTVRVVERRNLPKPVVAGRTYRDVSIAVEILGHLNAQCLLDRLGVGANAPGAVQDPCAAAGITRRAGVEGMPPRESPP